MRIASLRYAAVTLVAVTALACADSQNSVAPALAPLRALGGRDSAVFVLARSDNQTSAPIMTFGFECPSTPFKHTLSDTITIWSDGRARTASVFTRTRDGLLLDASHLSASGTWTRNTMPNVYYFSAAASIVLDLQFTTMSGQIWLRSEGDSAFTRLHPVEGSCNGVRTAREAIFTYARR